MATSKNNKFKKDFVSTLKDVESPDKLAEKAYRQAEAAFKAQISIAEGDKVNLETTLEEKIERLASARVNGGNAINSRTDYIQGIINAKGRVNDAVEAVKAQEELIQFLKDEFAALQS